MAPKVEEIEKNSIVVTKTDPLVFSISNSSGKEYEVRYDSNITACSCKDFLKYNWPCKHIITVFNHFPEHGLESLNKVYISMPYFNVDEEIINSLDTCDNREANICSELDSINTSACEQVKKGM